MKDLFGVYAPRRWERCCGSSPSDMPASWNLCCASTWAHCVNELRCCPAPSSRRSSTSTRCCARLWTRQTRRQPWAHQDRRETDPAQRPVPADHHDHHTPRQSVHRVDTKQPLSWSFPDAIAPHEPGWTVGFGSTHQRSQVRCLSRPPVFVQFSAIPRSNSAS